MVDTVSRETRSKMMKSIRSVSKLESMVSKDLWQRGLRFRRNTKALPGRPDISIIKYKIVLFIDSCFWHYCDIHGHYPKSNIEYWEKKIARNKQRDAEITSYYMTNEWNILRVWEHQLKEDYDQTIEHIYKFIIKAKNSKDSAK
ncbi:very short patch repair endonuclease [Paenibacillus jilunlii]|uniref:Very short patch repair endonuclease n=1 Tax=Paenibacillus jilunlii TaxID=682956 RepID=A0A1G9WKG6_9BACL|nr:very short patch repair endonuclease [Paenibacillus jilunlii]KWX73549.1 DNA mismatch repair protein Vsr [Paenibacillus jilunlii]SDM84656.1 T/G mismatch-specific endonuclease [Paenibacillus jilunlii]